MMCIKMVAHFWLQSLLLFSVFLSHNVARESVVMDLEAFASRRESYTGPTPCTGPLWSDSSPMGAVTAILRLTQLSITTKRGHGGRAPMVGGCALDACSTRCHWTQMCARTKRL